MTQEITWKVNGSNVTHSIPEKAVVRVAGEDGTLCVWLNEEGEVCFKKE